MNPISMVTGVITHPRRTVENVAGATYGVAATGARTAVRVLGWAVERSAGGTPEPAGATVESVTPPAKKAASKKAAVVAPALGLTEAEVLEDEVLEDEVRTPSGIPAAGEGINPDTTETDLHQPGTEPLMDPATVKSIKSEAEVMQKAADPDKG